MKVKKNRSELYNSPIGLTSQFRYCGNAFRVDTYKGCEFGCDYCFAKNNQYDGKRDFKLANLGIIKNCFNKAFELNIINDITTEMIQHRVPLHLGGMSDPFQPREFIHRQTYELLKLTKQYNYPMIISTKTAYLSEEYFDVLDPNIHAFQISLIGVDEEFVRRFEKRTPSPNQRINFVKQLKSKGFWVSIRIQPLIDLEQAKKIVSQYSDIVDYITVEHLKIYNKKDVKQNIIDLINPDMSDYKYTGKKYELKTEIKKRNIEQLKRMSHCPIGCGDNDLHEYSDTNNCCGIDTINCNFDNWLKYNLTYINKTKDRTQWCPETNIPKSGMGQYMKFDGCKKYKDFVDMYLKNE